MYSTIRFGTASKAAPQGRHLYRAGVGVELAIKRLPVIVNVPILTILNLWLLNIPMSSLLTFDIIGIPLFRITACERSS
jgi:hypothetical protein